MCSYDTQLTKDIVQLNFSNHTKLSRFTVFDKAALNSIIDSPGDVPAEYGQYFAHPTDITHPGQFSAQNGQGPDLPNAPQGSRQSENGLLAELRRVVYVDQMPPFDITLTGQNELGQRMMLQIFGVELLNQGSGVSVDDIP